MNRKPRDRDPTPPETPETPRILVTLTDADGVHLDSVESEADLDKLCEDVAFALRQAWAYEAQRIEQEKENDR